MCEYYFAWGKKQSVFMGTSTVHLEFLKLIFRQTQKCIVNHGFSINFTRKTKKNKQKSKFYFPMQILMYFDLSKLFDCVIVIK